MLDAKEERRYERLRKLGQELHIPIPFAFWTLEVFGKDGKLIQRHHQRCHSWVRNAYNQLFCQLDEKDGDDSTFGAGLLSAKDTGGTVRYEDAVIGPPYWEKSQTNRVTLDSSVDEYGYLAAAGDDDYGILVGSGENAESFEDYALQTPIVEGTGAGQLSHVASDPHDITWAAGPKTMTDVLVRYFNNNSGGVVSVNEVALVANIAEAVLQKAHVLMARDKLGATVDVPDTGQLKVSYTIQLTYPA